MGAVLGRLAVNGNLIIIGASDEMIEVPPNLILLDVDRLWAEIIINFTIHSRHLL